jgi:NAD(P)-dependent dehydrogenase (short-subunit alcohol dehydrogenase family)
MALKLEGRVAAVTGGASGIGAAAVRQLRGRGVRVASLDRARADAGSDLDLICDVRDPAALDRAIGEVVEKLGGLDLAFVNAGVSGGFNAFLDLSLEEWDRVIDVNLRGAMLTLQRAARAMVTTGRGGAIVATTSTSAFVVDRPFPHYSAAKSGLAQLVRVAARELGPKGIRVNAVAPGPTVTGMVGKRTGTQSGPFGSDYLERVAARTPLGRLGRPEDIAEAAVALFELEWITGNVLVCDGGVSLYSPIDGF